LYLAQGQPLFDATLNRREITALEYAGGKPKDKLGTAVHGIVLGEAHWLKRVGEQMHAIVLHVEIEHHESRPLWQRKERPT
jgi:hypothetical protein